MRCWKNSFNPNYAQKPSADINVAKLFPYQQESARLTVFGRVCRLGRWRDFARRRPVMTNLMQEVNGFTNEQNLEGGDDNEVM